LEISDETRKFDKTSLPEAERKFFDALWVDLSGCMIFQGSSSAQMKHRFVNTSDRGDVGGVLRFYDPAKKKKSRGGSEVVTSSNSKEMVTLN
jgi:hypothetical protein